MPTILVIDDDAIIQRVVKHAIKALNIETVSAFTGTQALELTSQQPFDLCMVDINLPDIDGFSLIQQLKARPEMVAVPFVAFTARNNPGDAGEAASLGAQAFLYKPFSTTELRDLISGLLAGS